MAITLAAQDNLPSGATLEERLGNLRRYGFDAVELRGWGLLDRLAETRGALRETGLPVSTICAGFDGSPLHPDPGQRRLALDGIKRLLDVAEELGAGGLIIAPDYGTPPLPDLGPAISSEQLLHDLLLTALREIGVHLRGMHTALFLEPLNRYESRALRRIEPGMRLCEESDAANMKIMFDTFHMAIEEADPIAVLRGAGERLGHVHLADSNRQLPGFGHTDFTAFMRALGEMGYGGAAALECGVPGDPDVLLPRCVNFLRQIATQ